MNRVEELSPLPGSSRELAIASLCSVLLHALLVWMFTAGGWTPPARMSDPLEIEILRPDEARRLESAQAAAPPGEAPQQEEREEEAPPSPPRTQIVAPPDSPEEIPDETRFLSEKNSRAQNEMVKRGEPAPPAEPPRSRVREAAKREGRPREERAAAEPQRNFATVPSLDSLFVKPSELLADPRLSRPGRDGTEGQEEQRDLASLGRPELWANPGDRGTPDYLPDVRQGSFTFLNTKADLFAPFVRRVGLRVFQTFSMDFRRRIFAGRVPAGKEKIEVEAVMTPDGRRLRVTLKHRDGNLATDRVLLDSLSDEIFFDENPPARAVAADGRIHFVFAIDAAVWYQQDPSGPVQPGAHWIFGAGLL